MSIAQKLSLAFLACSLLAFTGCVGPMARGPLGGCCGPTSATNSCACNGCGELYVDPWVNHPAQCVDPCDQCGNYNGQSCGRCRPMFDGIWSLWGYRCGDDCGDCGDTGCDVPCSGGFLGGGCGTGGCDCGAELCGPSCGCEGGCVVSDPSCGCESGCNSCGVPGGEVHYGSNDTIIEGSEYIVEGVPGTTTEGVSEIVPTNGPYKPERSRKIFNPKPRVATGDNRSVGY